MRPQALLILSLGLATTSLAHAEQVSVRGTHRGPAFTPASRTVEGIVLDSYCRPTKPLTIVREDGSTATRDTGNILTEASIQTESGEIVTVWQPGGTYKGQSMWMSHSPPLLKAGDRVTIDIAEETDTEGVLNTPQPGVGEPARLLRVRDLASIGGGTASAGLAAFVRTENPTGAELYWPIREIDIVYSQEGSTQISGTREFDEMDKVFRHWEASSLTCDVKPEDDPEGDAIQLVTFNITREPDAEVGNDGTNVVKFREDTWCRPIEDGKEMCYNPSAAGLTTLFFVNDEDSDRNGEIVDADIEFNGVNFVMWVEGDAPSATGCEAELGNTMTHEVGHFLGLDHTCWDGTPPRRNDSNGDPVPRCSPASSLSDEVKDATMYNFQGCAETSKKTLAQGDIDFLCDVYLPIPPSSGGGGCSCATATPTQISGTFGWLLLVGLVFRRRRRG